jgi:hypothetical protein
MNSPADLVDIRSRESAGLELREAGCANAGPPVLLLPGGFCSATFYALDACPNVAVEVVAGATHFLPTEEPRRTAELILRGVAEVASVG